MSRKFLLVASVLISCATIAPLTVRADDRHSMPHSHDMKSGMSHGKMEIAAGQPVPTAALEIKADPMGGWNVQVKTTNFEFAPERVNQSNIASEGHAHLYVNGKKVARLYSNWYHLDALPTGKNTIMVTLNTNKHEDLFYQGKRIEAMQQITVSPAAPKK